MENFKANNIVEEVSLQKLLKIWLSDHYAKSILSFMDLSDIKKTFLKQQIYSKILAASSVQVLRPGLHKLYFFVHKILCQQNHCRCISVHVRNSRRRRY